MVWEPSSCCGINRRPAGYIIASITAINYTLLFAHTLYVLANGKTYLITDEYCKSLTNTEDQTANCIDVSHRYFNGLMSVQLVMAILHIIFSFLLVHGIRTNKPRLMLPYLVMMLIDIVLFTLFAALMVVVSMLFSIRIALAVAIIFGGIIFIMTYFNLVVRAHYKEISEPIMHNYNKLTA